MITRERTDPLVERCKDRDSVIIHYDYFEQLVELSRWALDARQFIELIGQCDEFHDCDANEFLKSFPSEEKFKE